MKWRKLGLVFSPDNQFPWMTSHAANPFVVSKNETAIRIFFTCRNSLNQSHISFVDLNADQNFSVAKFSSTPLLSPGEPGLFDDSGVAMGHYLEFENEILLYYLGWNLKVTVPWLNSIGLAKWDGKENRFVKYSKAPIMDRSQEDPYSISYPSILMEDGILKMWYGSNLNWGKNQNSMEHVIKCAESNDGIIWSRTNRIAIALHNPFEYAISKPCVIKENGLYKMWYSFRGSSTTDNYRIGYAESTNGYEWIRMDNQVGIDVSLSGWDSEMICYPHIFDYRNNRYMLYNGNGYGRTGFGLAILEK